MPGLDLLKLADETDLDIFNNCMETMVERYHAELLPVAAQLTARLVRADHELIEGPPSYIFFVVLYSANPTCASCVTTWLRRPPLRLRQT